MKDRPAAAGSLLDPRSRPRPLLRRVRDARARHTVMYEGLPLPPYALRVGGAAYRDDQFFVRYADSDVARLREWLGLSAETRVLDVGCGQCRLAIGILRKLGSIGRYCGLDLDPASIEWGRRHISSRDAAFEFHVLEAGNERYNPAGPAIDENFRLPFGEAEFDLGYMSGVAPHLVTHELRAYFREFRRLLDPGGGLYVTAFLEEGVPPMTINPPDYLGGIWVGPRNCIRYETGFFVSLLEEAQLEVDRCVHAAGAFGQSLVTARLR